MEKIPTYTAEWPGARLRDYSPASILKLEALGAVTVRRDADGRIRSARFLPASRRPATSLRGTGLARVRFTRLERVGERRIIAHRPLPYAAVDRALGYPSDRRAIEAAVRRLFLTSN